MRRTNPVSILAPTLAGTLALLAFSPLAQASPDEAENTNLGDLVDEGDGGEPEGPNYKSPIVPSPAECLTMAEYETMTQYNSYAIDVWGLHALAWTAHMHPLISYTPPGPNSNPAPPTGRPSTGRAGDLWDLEATPSVFASDPDGAWMSVGTYGTHDALAHVALVLNRFQTPVYLEIDPLVSKQVGDPEVFVVERMSVATAGADFGASCLFDSQTAASDCINAINHWWTIGEVEGVVYYKGGGHMRVSLLGPDFTSLVHSTYPNYSAYVIYNRPQSPGFMDLDDSAKALALRYYVAEVQGCPDIALGDTPE